MLHQTKLHKANYFGICSTLGGEKSDAVVIQVVLKYHQAPDHAMTWLNNTAKKQGTETDLKSKQKVK